MLYLIFTLWMLNVCILERSAISFHHALTRLTLLLVHIIIYIFKISSKSKLNFLKFINPVFINNENYHCRLSIPYLGSPRASNDNFLKQYIKQRYLLFSVHRKVTSIIFFFFNWKGVLSFSTSLTKTFLLDSALWFQVHWINIT